jgi:hypothetical protein
MKNNNNNNTIQNSKRAQEIFNNISSKIGFKSKYDEEYVKEILNKYIK